MRVYFITTDSTVEQEPYYAFIEKLSYYVSDIDGDRNDFIREEYFVVSEDPQTSEEKAVYQKLDAVLANEETIALIVDDVGYAYVSEKTELQTMEFFQVESGDEYKFLLNDSQLMEGITLGDGRNYYVVMRYFDPENYTKNYYLSGRTDLWVGMLRNNDQSEENNVAIS